MKSRLQRLKKTLLLFSVWKVTLHSKCSALGRPWEVRAMNVKVDFTLRNSLDCMIDVASSKTYTSVHQHSQMSLWRQDAYMQTHGNTHDICRVVLLICNNVLTQGHQLTNTELLYFNYYKRGQTGDFTICYY